jgi:thermopsin
MRVGWGPSAGAVAVALLVSLSAVATVGSSGLAAASAVAHPAPPVSAASPPVPGVPAAGSGGPSVPTTQSISNVGAQLAARALAATRAAGLSAKDVFVPRPSATAQQIAEAEETGAVTPLYRSSPAPMGLGYFGLSEGPGATYVSSILNTTSVVGTVSMNATGVRNDNLGLTSPDAFSIQLNAVTTNVTLSGRSPYAFWTQNVVLYTPANDSLTFLSNLWNWSSATAEITSSTLYANHPGGMVVQGDYYYDEVTVPEPIAYPFNLTLWLNSSVDQNRNEVTFGAQLTGAGVPGGSFAENYDWVVFNSVSSAPGGSGAASDRPSNFTADGKAYNALGLTDDYELSFGGPGAGSQATLFDADATLGLGYWNGTAFAAVPSAFTYGGETGETSTGADVAWSNASAGEPFPGLSTYGTMTTGPSILTGLWNASGPEGSFPLTVAVTPSNAITIVTASSGWSAEYATLQPEVAPGLFTDVFSLPPGNYTLLTELTDYAPITHHVDLTGPTTLAFSLASDPALGVYTPLWTSSNAGIAAVSTGGSGTPTSPYVIASDQPGTLSSTYGLYNDYGFSVYPAVLFYNTSATTEFLRPPSFSTATYDATGQDRSYPAVNDLPYWFYNASHVAIVGAANISGWFPIAMFLYPGFSSPFNVVFFDGGHNLVANDTFDTEAQALLLFEGAGTPGPLGSDGGNNTVFGNRFYEVPAPTPPNLPSPGCLLCFTLPSSDGLALEVAESNDLIYNNYVDTPTTVWVPTFSLYTEAFELFTVTLNVSSQPSSTVDVAPGFPFWPLSGNILGLPLEGGNFWWDYGLGDNPYNGADNPFGVLPYDENAVSFLDPYGPFPFVFPGGDYLPLTLAPFYAVTLTEHDLPSGLVWGAGVVDREGFLASETTTALTSYTVNLAPGTYTVESIAPPGWTTSPARLSVTDRPVALSLAFRVATGAGDRALTFYRAGPPALTPWSVTIVGTSPATWAYNASETTAGPSLEFAVGPGTYAYRVGPVPGYQAPAPGSATVGRANVGVTARYTVYTFPVTVTQVGLPIGMGWSVSVDRRTARSTEGTDVVGVPNGTYTFVVHAPAGWIASPASGSITITAGPGTLSVTFSRR